MQRINLRLPLALILLLILAAATASCVKKVATDDFDEGSIDNSTSTYSNKYLGFSLTLPKTWLLQDSQTQRMVTDAGKKMVTGNNKALRDAYNESMVNNHMLLTLFKHPVSEAVDFNPSFIVQAEKISPALHIEKGSDYIEQARKTMESGSMKLPFKDSGSENLGGAVFDKAEATYPLGKITIKQRIYATIRKGYAVSIITTLVSDEDEATVDGILKSVKFM
ncbi:MAG: hypothetical protein ACREDR_01170 [Blastocatellia bacterium]